MMHIIVIFLLSFVIISLFDALWHLVLFKKIYLEDFALVAAKDKSGKMQLRPLPGLLSQVFVVGATAFLVLFARGEDMIWWQSGLLGSAAGILAISVYGLVNYSLLHAWSKRLTILEFIWGPMLGFIGGSIIHLLNLWLK